MCPKWCSRSGMMLNVGCLAKTYGRTAFVTDKGKLMFTDTHFSASGGSPPKGESAKKVKDARSRAARKSKRRKAVPPELTIHTHGLTDTPSNETCYWAWIAFDTRNLMVAMDSGEYGNGFGVTPNAAKFHAVIQALSWLKNHAPDTPARVLTDLKLVAGWLEKGWKCHESHLRQLRQVAADIRAETKAKIEWMPHARNKAEAILKRRQKRMALRKKAA